MKKIVSSILSVFILLAVTQTVFAAGSSTCDVVYGGGQVCQEQIKFTINKLVQKPGGDYVENLTVNDPHYSASQNVNFKIVIQNTGKADIKNLNVVDNFPQFLTFLAGAGATNVGSQQINFTIGNLPKGKKVEYVITAKIANDAALPASKINCVTNAVTATATDGSEAHDNSQVCIEKNIVAPTPTPQIMQKPVVEKIPATGPETDILLALVPLGSFGFYLRRKFS